MRLRISPGFDSSGSPNSFDDEFSGRRNISRVVGFQHAKREIELLFEELVECAEFWRMTGSLELRVIASDQLSATIVPQLGGRLIELQDLRHARQWLWRNHRVPIGPVDRGAEYDDVWQGGFEELFPNDAPTTREGVDYPDHGELWSIPWEVVEAGSGSVTLSVVGPTTGVRVAKTFSVVGPKLTVRYTLRHDGEAPLPHLFKPHPAFAVHERCRIDLPGGTVEKVERSFGNMLWSTKPEEWPAEPNLSQCRSHSSGEHEFFYVSNLPGGWCGITDLKTESWVRVDYPQEVFPYCWIFMTYGGWRDHNVVVLEPCTNYPKDLATAISRGSHAILPAESETEIELTISVGSMDD